MAAPVHLCLYPPRLAPLHHTSPPLHVAFQGSKAHLTPNYPATDLFCTHPATSCVDVKCTWSLLCCLYHSVSPHPFPTLFCPTLLGFLYSFLGHTRTRPPPLTLPNRAMPCHAVLNLPCPFHPQISSLPCRDLKRTQPQCSLLLNANSICPAPSIHIPSLLCCRDLKRTRPQSSLLFNAMFNLHKFLAFENRDPFASRAEAGELAGLTDWDKFARQEYFRWGQGHARAGRAGTRR